MVVQAKKDSEASGSGAAVQVKDEEINFFSKIVMNAHGQIANDQPAWCNKRQTEQLREEIRAIEYRLDNKQITGAYEPIARAELVQRKERLGAIERSFPNLSDRQRDKIDAECKDLGEKLSRSMFTRSDMMKGVADAHEEADRMTEPCIKLTDWQAGKANEHGYRLSNAANRNGKEVSTPRDCAMKLWKILRKALGESAHTELLRKA